MPLRSVDRTLPKPTRRTRAGWRYAKAQTRFALLLLVPAAAAIVLFIAYPVLYSLALTFSKFTIKEVLWFKIGLRNYSEVLQDRDFGGSIAFTMTYTALYVPLSVGLALFVAVLLQQARHGTAFFRSVLFLPTVIPLTMGYMMFQWILDPQNGILNYLLRAVLGLPGLTRNWLSDMKTVTGSLIGVTLWGFGPWILMLAGILSISKDYYEAARIDGASPLQEFLYITLPLLRTSLLVVTTLQLIRSLKVFVPIYVLTGGGPANASQSLYFLVFDRISQNKLTYATTVGWAFTIIVLALALVPPLVFRSSK